MPVFFFLDDDADGSLLAFRLFVSLALARSSRRSSMVSSCVVPWTLSFERAESASLFECAIGSVMGGI